MVNEAVLIACLAVNPFACIKVPVGQAVSLEECLATYLPAAVAWQQKNLKYRIKAIRCGKVGEMDI